jgi:hypothetical protein
MNLVDKRITEIELWLDRGLKRLAQVEQRVDAIKAIERYGIPVFIADQFKALEKRVDEIENAIVAMKEPPRIFANDNVCHCPEHKEPPKHDEDPFETIKEHAKQMETLECVCCGQSRPKPQHDVAREQLSPSVGLPEPEGKCSCGWCKHCKQEPEDPIEKFNPQCFDAKLWADEFIRLNKSSDHGTMHTWFASAIMAGFDEARRREPEDSIRIDRKIAENYVERVGWGWESKMFNAIRQSLSDKKSKGGI